MSAHTPGPWFVYLPRGVSGGCRGIRTEDGRSRGTYRGVELATTTGLSPDDEDLANATVLAAAPALLAACKAQHAALDLLLAELVARVPGFLPSHSPAWPAVVLGNAAIAKAEVRPLTVPVTEEARIRRRQGIGGRRSGGVRGSSAP